MLFTRQEEWRLFLNLETLVQRANVPLERIPRLLVKELVDNALDTGHACRFGELENGGIFVEDDGPGFAGSDEAIASLFSLDRPLVSSKLVRMPTRGALGNGLRLVTGAVFASHGSLVVRTRGRSLFLKPQEDGRTTLQSEKPWKQKGTRIEVQLGEGLATADDVLAWGRQAQALAGRGTSYCGNSSPWWYSAETFWELCKVADNASVRDVIAQLQGCAGGKTSLIARDFSGRQSATLSRTEATALLQEARARSRPVKPRRLGFVGRLEAYPSYARTQGTIEVGPRGNTTAMLPFTLEAWARPEVDPRIVLCVNRSPIAAELDLFRPAGEKSAYGLVGCQLSHSFRAPKSREFGFLVNIQCPHVPITTDGKSPDLSFFRRQLLDTMTTVAIRARRAVRGSGPSTGNQKHFIVNSLPQAIRHASGAGQYRFSQRQLFYAVRPLLLEAYGVEPDYGWFCKVLTSYENEHGEIAQMYRDARGTLYHPHTGEEIPLGTREVESYRRPEWTFNKILYCEKEGFFPILQDAHWPERHDCALLTSKGFATRAARDVLDLLGASGEAIRFFCVHDADGPGTMIYESLQQGTDARPGRQVEIVNLGLEPEEALEMGLATEPVERKDGRTVPVAGYVAARWQRWLQTHRVELNAMSTPQFLTWLDQKIGPYDRGKLVPPSAVLTQRLRHEVRERSFEQTRARILREQRFEEQAESDFRRLHPALCRAAQGLQRYVKQTLQSAPTQWWPHAVVESATTVVNDPNADHRPANDLP
jgi:hypothetical protein